MHYTVQCMHKLNVEYLPLSKPEHKYYFSVVKYLKYSIRACQYGDNYCRQSKSISTVPPISSILLSSRIYDTMYAQLAARYT